MKYLLDTNAITAILYNRTSPVLRQVRRHDNADIGISAIVAYELYFGAFRSRQKDRNLSIIDSVWFQTVEFGRKDARHAAEIRALLESKGTPIGPYDLLIAGQARARALTLVTHNIREFRRVPGLHVVDWERDRGPKLVT